MCQRQQTYSGRLLIGHESSLVSELYELGIDHYNLQATNTNMIDDSELGTTKSRRWYIFWNSQYILTHNNHQVGLVVRRHEISDSNLPRQTTWGGHEKRFGNGDNPVRLVRLSQRLSLTG